MPVNRKPADPTKVVKIECFDLPTSREIGEGDYELRWGHRPKEPTFHDIVSLERELKKIMPSRAEDILDRLQNFKVAYLNLATGEITS